MAKTIALANHKGGVGKTCSCVNIGAALGNKKKRTLLIDLDPQSNLSLSLGVSDPQKSIYGALTGQYSLEDCVMKIDSHLFLAPSDIDLSGAELELVGEPGREFILRDLINEIGESYEYVLIDCPPSLGLLTLNALTAAQEVYVPLQAEYLAAKGLSKLNEIVEKVQKKLNKDLIIGGVFLTQYDNRKILNRDVADVAKSYFKDRVFKTKIRENIALGEAPSTGKDIFRYAPSSNGAKDYIALTNEILAISKKQKTTK